MMMDIQTFGSFSESSIRITDHFIRYHSYLNMGRSRKRLLLYSLVGLELNLAKRALKAPQGGTLLGPSSSP